MARQVSELLDRFVDLFNTANARAWKEAFPDARGTITRSTHYIDVAGMMAQLGAGGSARA